MAKVADYAPASLADLGTFLDADEKAAIAGFPLDLAAVIADPGNRFGPRWIVSVIDRATGEKYALGFATNATRDRSMTALRDALDAGTTFDPVAIEKVTPEKGGNAFWIIRDATAEEIAAGDAAKGTGDAAEAPAPKLRKAAADA